MHARALCHLARQVRGGGYFRGIVVSIMGDEMTHETHEDWDVSQWLHFDELVGGGAWP